MSLPPLKYFESLYPPTTREREIHEYLMFLKRGLSAQLVGIPGTGKSNVLRLLAYNRDVREHHFKDYERYMHFVYMDSTDVRGKTTFELMKFILASLSFSLGERRMLDESIEIDRFYKDAVQLNDEVLLLQALKKSLNYLSIEKKLSIVLLFDKFDALVPTVTADFFTNLRSLRNHAKYRFGVIFSVRRPLHETIDHSVLMDFSDLITDNEVYANIYDPVGLTFRLDYIKKASRNRADTNVLKEELINLTGGLAQLTKLGFEAAVEEEKISDLSAFLLALPGIKNTLDEIWNTLLPGEQKALQEGVSAQSLEEFPYLKKSGLLTPDGIAIPLLAQYITNATRTTHHSLSYDEERGEVLQDGLVITHKLSPSEFRLITFLIQERGRTITKDEIINAVWPSDKTHEGVTDQALDQIFYRLRKKVEDDPTHPSLIITVKGRGYKLSE